MTNKVNDVFGVTRDLPLNYIERDHADNILIDSLSRDKHLVIYGSSKQGKTCLRKHCLQDNDYIVVHCNNRWELSDLNSAILKKAGYEISQSNTRSYSGKQKIIAKVVASFFGAGGQAGAESEREEGAENTTVPLELDPDDVNDIITALDSKNFDKLIVLEDFHYLPIETQQNFSVALKAYHENSKYLFIIIGVWLEENRLTVYNGDLTGRVLPINADKWYKEELTSVINKGENLLNIEFDENFKIDLLHSCFSNVYIVQEACHICCEENKVFSTQSNYITVGSQSNANHIVESIVKSHTGRFNAFLISFAEGFQSTKLEMYRWILYVILKSSVSDLENGLTQKYIRDVLQKYHPEGQNLNPGNISQALQSVLALQISKDIKPTVLDYDQTNMKLHVVDRSFLIWFEYQDSNQLLNLLSLPIS